MDYSKVVACALLEIKAVGFVSKDPITFKSGMKSPVYIDNRILPFHPNEWRQVLDGWKDVIDHKNIKIDVVAGIESAGIPHSATLGYILHKPSVFCRKQLKDHGTMKLIEGGDVKGKRVLLIEDHVSTGGSSIAGVKALRDSGAVVTNCLAVTSFEFLEAGRNFKEAKVKLTTITSIKEILEQAVRSGLITKQRRQNILAWQKDPWGWSKSHNHNMAE